MRKYANCYFCNTNDIFMVRSTNFLVCRKKNFESAVQTFAASLPPFGVSFCNLMARVLPPYGVSFASLWRVFFCLMLSF